MSIYFQVCPDIYYSVIMGNSIFSSEGWTLGLLLTEPHLGTIHEWWKLRWGGASKSLRKYDPPAELMRLYYIRAEAKTPAAERAALPAPRKTAPATPPAKPELPSVTWEELYQPQKKKSGPVWSSGVRVFLKFGSRPLQERVVIGVAAVNCPVSSGKRKRRFMLLLYR
jgi:hypothetical protein